MLHKDGATVFTETSSVLLPGGDSLAIRVDIVMVVGSEQQSHAVLEVFDPERKQWNEVAHVHPMAMRTRRKSQIVDEDDVMGMVEEDRAWLLDTAGKILGFEVEADADPEKPPRPRG